MLNFTIQSSSHVCGPYESSLEKGKSLAELRDMWNAMGEEDRNRYQDLVAPRTNSFNTSLVRPFGVFMFGGFEGGLRNVVWG